MRTRKIGIEYLRILSMLFIIADHFLLFTGALDYTKTFSMNYYGVWLLEAIGYVGVDCFVLISGYFLIQSQFSWKKVFGLIGEVWFYSMTIIVFLKVLYPADYSIIHLFKSFFPLSTRQYWFMTDYIALYILSPFINLALKQMKEKQYNKLICILLLLFSVWELLPGEQLNGQKGYSLYWLIVLYCVGAYIRLFEGGVLQK